MSSTGAATSTTSGELQSGSSSATASGALQSGSSSATASDVAVVAATNENAQHQRTVESIVGDIAVHQLQQQQQLAKLTGGGAAASAAAAVTSAGLTGGASGDSSAGGLKRSVRAASAAATQAITERGKRKGAGADSSTEGGAASSKKIKHEHQNPDFTMVLALSKEVAANAKKALDAFKAAKIRGVKLLKGPLPESSRSDDPHRTFFDIINGKLRKELEPLIKESEAAFRKQLKTIHVDEDELHMVVLKLLVTKPGAAAQEVHLDVVKDADQCWGVLLHCTDTKASTFVPANTDTCDLLRKLTQPVETITVEQLKQAVEIKKDLNKHFKNQQASAGDALFFKTDVAHFGPAVPANEPQRIMLYALFSIDKDHKDADKKQVQPLADLATSIEQLRKNTQAEQFEHAAEAQKLFEAAKEKNNKAKECAEQVKTLLRLKNETAAPATPASPKADAAAAK